MKKILDAADVISEVRRALSRIEQLQENQREILSSLEGQERRIRELEASLREAKAQILLEAVKETQGIVNSVQSGLYREIKDISVSLERLNSRELNPGAVDGHKRPMISTDD